MVRANAPTLETGYTCAVDPLANNETMLANREESIYAIWRGVWGLFGLEAAPVLEFGVTVGAVVVTTEAVLALLPEEPESNPRNVSATLTASALRR